MCRQKGRARCQLASLRELVARAKGRDRLVALTASARQTNGKPNSAPLKIAPQIGSFLLRGPTDIEGRNKSSLLVHQVDHGRVIHGVVAALKWHFLGIDAVGAQ